MVSGFEAIVFDAIVLVTEVSDSRMVIRLAFI
jgi:hypothetical protein